MTEHKFVHIEIPTKDLSKAKEFYEKVFSWKVMTETGFPDYAVFTTGETGVGGGFQKSDRTSSGEILVHIQTEDIPQTLKMVELSGGKTIQGKTEIGGGMGFYAVFKDNSGNVLGLWSQT